MYVCIKPEREILDREQALSEVEEVVRVEDVLVLVVLHCVSRFIVLFRVSPLLLGTVHGSLPPGGQEGHGVLVFVDSLLVNVRK